MYLGDHIVVMFPEKGRLLPSEATSAAESDWRLNLGCPGAYQPEGAREVQPNPR
jgi:hypothetical protein